MIDHKRRLGALSYIYEFAQPSCKNAELFDRYRATKDPDAFDAMLEQCAPKVFGVCFRILRNRHDAEEVCQDTLLQLVRKANSIKNGAALPGWLH